MHPLISRLESEYGCIISCLKENCGPGGLAKVVVRGAGVIPCTRRIIEECRISCGHDAVRHSYPFYPAPARTISKQLDCTQKVKAVKAEQGSNVTEKVMGAITRDLVLCGKRVKELLKGRLHGLYIAQLEKIYEKKFSENLPDDWARELNAAGDIVVVKEEGGLLLVKYGEGSTVALTSKENPDDGLAAKIEETKGQKDRVLQLLRGRVYGLLVSQVEKMFFKQWSEKLEGDWVSKLEQLGGVVVDREGEQCVIIMTNRVLYL